MAVFVGLGQRDRLEDAAGAEEDGGHGVGLRTGGGGCGDTGVCVGGGVRDEGGESEHREGVKGVKVSVKALST